MFPALLPFFISSELLMGYGVIQFMGVILEPIMRPLFNLPGVSSFVMAVGYTSGFPISASLAARLRKEKLCTRLEAERLMCFTNNASPLFMLVAVGAGMFYNARLGVLIALCHYAANLLLGLLLRFYGRDDPKCVTRIVERGHLFQKALREMKKAHRANARPFGRMLGDAITSSVNKLLVIGGFVIVFSIIIKLSVLTGIMSIITKAMSLVTMPLGFTGSAVNSIGYGFFEITLGAKAAAEAAAPLIQRLIAAGIILGWSGVSVLAQVSAMISETDLKMGLFIFCRLLHAVFAGLFSYLLLQNHWVTAWLAKPAGTNMTVQTLSLPWFTSLFYFARLCAYSILAWTLVAVIVYIVRSLSVIRFRV